ncbi:MAG TPA: hypothetical protein VMS99_16385 [Acidimicrobiia bacterium]|nr:hypothetical protein [Acidimicrobiia bacterium]
MRHLTWIETLDGWISGRYQIELAAPRLWVLSRRPKTTDDTTRPLPAKLVSTAGSLRELKHLAGEIDRRRQGRKRLLTHLLAAFVLTTAAFFGSAIGWDLTIPAFVAVFGITLRTLVMWVDHVTGCAWSVVSDNYQ